MVSTLKTKVKVKEHIPELALRKQCDELFHYIESLPEEHIVVDFNGFDICSRSFAHQYSMNKEKSSKKIEEINIRFIVDMFNVVKRQIERDRQGRITTRITTDT
jgi:hypothetical protein